MLSFLTFICLVGMILPVSLANIIAYPISKKLSVKISDYIVRVMAPRLFSVLKVYSNYSCWTYKETKNNLPDQFLLISNHQSLFDIPLYMRFLDDKSIRFVAKDTLGRHIPLVSEMLRAHEHCLVPRKAKPMEAMRYMEEFGKRCIDRNQIPILFPEGSRTRDGNVGKFYSAGFRKLAESTGLPIVVCALDGGYKLRDLKKVMTNLKYGCCRVAAIKVYDPPKTKEDCNTILDESRVLIQNQLEEWRKLPANKKY